MPYLETALRGIGIPSAQERCAQPFTKRRVGGDDGHRLPEHRHRFGHSLARNEVRHDAPEFDGRQIRITACRRGPCSVDARGHVAEVERAEPQQRLGGGSPVVAALLRLRQRQQVVLGLDENATLRGEVHQPFERVLVGGRHFQDALVEGFGARQEPFARQVIRDAREQRRRAVHASNAQVEIGERVGRLPVVRGVLENALVFVNRGIVSTETDELLCVLQRAVPIECHPCLAHPPASGVSRSYQRGTAA